MSSAELGEFVGGPLCGQTYASTARWFTVPDASDMRQGVSHDGDVYTLFGEHTYEQVTYLFLVEGRIERKAVWQYRGYKKP